MADWRQIQARIRKAKNSPDAPAKLSELYARTRDAMVAWELGTIEEKEARNETAVKWYTISAERFRRPDWKKKAEEALTRLGAPIPIRSPQLKPNMEENTESFHIPATETVELGAQPFVVGELAEPQDEEEIAPAAGNVSAIADRSGDADGAKKKRRRGRRGGRNRRRKSSVSPPALPTQAFAESFESQTPPKVLPLTYTPSHPPEAPPAARPAAFEEPEARASASALSTAQSGLTRSAQGRAGDPALASRMAHLESMLRRLVSGAAHRLSEAEEAPAGPGVFLLSDSDLVTSYYVEACQTLRVGLGNLARGGRGAKSARTGRSFSGDGLKSKLAEHLGISESKVSQYLKDHCVVRWIQLDEEAPLLAHFAIGVLRTPLNLD